MAERRIAEHAAFLEELLVERLEVVSHHLSYHGQLRIACLENHLSTAALASRPSGYLRHHHEGVLVGAEVGVVQHGVGVENAHHGDVAEVETLAHHLRAYEQIGVSGREFADDALVRIARACGVEVHPRDTCLGEDVAHPVLDILRSVSPSAQVGAAAARTTVGHIEHTAAVMARKASERLMESEAHIALVAMRDPPAHVALGHRSEAAAVVEEYRLASVSQRAANRREQSGRERTAHHLAAAQVFDVHHLYLRQLYVLVACHYAHQSVLARERVAVALRRRSG
ncbi:unknown [Prevotella sp. CAG:487]|nr:unknown [Prevotella sp. CAG:487]